MSDTQPLLASSRDAKNESTRPKLFNNLFRSCQNFRNKWNSINNNNLETKQNEKHAPVNLFQLFRYANRHDLCLLVIGLSTILGRAICVCVNVILLGQITNLFAIISFNDNLFAQVQNTSSSIKSNNIICPWEIQSNSFTNQQRFKLCNEYYQRTSSSPKDTVIDPILQEAITSKFYWLLISTSIDLVCNFIQYSTFAIVAKRQACRIRTHLFQSLIQRDISYFDTNAINRVNVKVFDKIDIIERGMGFELASLILTTFIIVINVIVSFIIDWKLTIILICILPALLGGLYLFTKLSSKETKIELNSYTKAGRIVEEVFSSIRTVFSLNGQNVEHKRYEMELQSIRWNCIRKGAILGLLTGWFYGMMRFIYFIAFLVGFYLMVDDNCNIRYISNIISITILIAYALNFIACFSPCLQSIVESCCAAAEIFDLIDQMKVENINEKDIFKENIYNSKTSDINGDIEFINVNFSYPTRKDRRILQNINFVASAGKTTAIVGPTGCGKSTCISLLLRYYKPSTGQIMINGQSITKYNIQQLRQNIGVVNQEPILFNTTIYENICYGKENATKDEIEEAARQANAHNFIMQLPDKYETMVGERGIKLSGGEKQRIALARILIKQPKILLLDEATSALDNHNEKLVQLALDQACKNRTTIVIAHRLSTIQNADYIYVFDEGKIIEQGTHDTLIKFEEGLYKQMMNIQKMGSVLNEDDINENIIQVEEEQEEKEISHLIDRTYSLGENQNENIDKTQSSTSKSRFVFLRLLSMNKPEWLSILIGCIMSTIAGACQIVFALLLAKTIDLLSDCIQSQKSNKIIITTCSMLAISIILFITRFFQFTAFAISGSKLTERIRVKAFATLLRQEVAYFDQVENNSNAISNRLSSEARSIQQMTGARLSILCEASITIGSGLILSFVFQYQLGFILLIYLGFLTGILCLNVYSKAKFAQRSKRILTEATGLCGDVLDNMRTIKHLTVEKKVLQKYTELNEQLYKVQRIPSILSAIAYTLLFSTWIYAVVVIFWRALVLAGSNELDQKYLILVFAIAFFLMQNVQVLWIIIEGGGALVSDAQSFFALFDRIPTIDNGSTEGQQLNDFPGDIEFDQVRFVYPSRSTSSPILNHFRLSIKQGQRIALVGASGCGKSTVIQLLERFYDVTHGHLYFDGVDIRQLNIHWLRSCFGLVTQEPILFDMNIAENVSYPNENVPLEEIIDATTKANIHQFIQQLPQGYETRVGSKGHQLSGGEKQRIAIARALFRRPKILLLDEATSAMDLRSEQAVQEVLEQIQHNNSTETMVIIAHRLSTIRSCDVICVLENGHIIESGTHTELIQHRGLYYRMLTHNHF